jgi:hypothetical protein
VFKTLLAIRSGTAGGSIVARLITIEIVLRGDEAVCVPEQVEVFQKSGDVIQWFTNAGDHKASFPTQIFDIPEWTGKKGRPSQNPGVLLPNAPTGEHMAKVTLTDKDGKALNKKGGTNVIVK